MNSEETLLETIKDWQYWLNRIKKLEERLEEHGYSVTAGYSDVKVSSSGTAVSKLESYCLSRMEIQRKIDAISDKLKLCKYAYENANLTEYEKLTISYTSKGKSLLVLSRELNIAQARIYRIRARAIKKMYAVIQNTVKS